MTARETIKNTAAANGWELANEDVRAVVLTREGDRVVVFCRTDGGVSDAYLNGSYVKAPGRARKVIDILEM